MRKERGEVRGGIANLRGVCPHRAPHSPLTFDRPWTGIDIEKYFFFGSVESSPFALVESSPVRPRGKFAGFLSLLYTISLPYPANFPRGRTGELSTEPYGRVSYDNTTVTIADALQKLATKITINNEKG